MKIVRVLVVMYAAASLLSLWLIPASVRSWMGVEPDPLSPILATVLAMSWILAVRMIDPLDPALSIFVLAAGMTINFAVLAWLGWRRRAP